MEDVAVDSGNPLLRAVFLRRLRLTRLLLEGGAYINESNSRGQTPLMVACRTQHVDGQSASRVKLVQFLLEKGADPDIQDKDGRSALMHACREQAGAEVVSLLLASAADIGLEDQSGTSALVYAVTAGDLDVLKLLLDACKAKGKEVIIITTDKFPCGTLRGGQHLGMPPPDPSAAPASPSEIQLITSPPCASSSLGPPNPVFSFKDAHSHPCSPSHGLQQPLLRLNSEPWLKIPASLLAQPPRATSGNGQDVGRSRELPFSVVDLDRRCGGQLARGERVKGKNGGTRHAGAKVSLPGLASPHSASHPNLHSENLGADPLTSSRSFSGGKSLAAPFHSVASSSLCSIIQRRKLGSDIYSSDPQLAVDTHNLPDDAHLKARDPTEGKRLAPLRCSGESLLSSGPSRRVLSGYERRGSATFLLDHNSQLRPRSLPPLTPNTPTGNVHNATSAAGGEKESGLKHLLPSAPPGRPKELTRRMLLRRHSMQTEQFKGTA